MKRKVVTLLLSIIVSTGIMGCGSTNSTDVAELEKRVSELTEENENLKAQLNEVQQQEEETSTEVIETGESEEETEEKEEAVTTINIGDTITTENKEVLINSIDFSYKVEPEDTSGYYNYYSADSGKVYIAMDVDVKNLQKSDINCDEVMKVTADYNNGYSYSAFSIVEDKTLGFNYSNINSISPLETMGMRYLIDCPEEVATSDVPLIITFSIDGQNYNYQMR